MRHRVFWAFRHGHDVTLKDILDDLPNDGTEFRKA